MANVMETVKKLLANKNTVTILGVFAGILVLYIGYNMRIQKDIQPISIPYAKEALPSRTKITDSMIGYMEVPSTLIKKSPNIVQSNSQIVGKYVAFGVTIPENSFFYNESVMSKDQIPSSAYDDSSVPDNYTVYSLSVDLHSTYGNSIRPGNYIDLYIKAEDENDLIIFGKLIESIKVLAVKDDEGNHVFESSEEDREPAELLFAVPNDMYELLMDAGFIRADVEIIPVPRNASYSDKKDDKSTKVSSKYLESFIKSQTTNIASSSN